MVTRDQKLEAIAGFLEYSASAQIDGHSSHDGVSCKGHSEAFEAKAAELLELIGDNFGYEPTESETAEYKLGRQLWISQWKVIEAHAAERWEVVATTWVGKELISKARRILAAEATLER